MEATIQKIDHLTQSLAELQPLKPEYQQKLDKKIRLEFNYNSNHIEGNTLTYGETELLLIFDKTTGNHEQTGNCNRLEQLSQGVKINRNKEI
jgi:Fic family protein